jgi:hypothetical protein
LREVQEAKERASSELQKNVFKNYMEFVALSKEIGKVVKGGSAPEIHRLTWSAFCQLEDDMLVLRNLVQDLKSVATDQTEDEPVGVAGLGWWNCLRAHFPGHIQIALELARQDRWCQFCGTKYCERQSNLSV